jgi:hypothetical protein
MILDERTEFADAAAIGMAAGNAIAPNTTPQPSPLSIHPKARHRRNTAPGSIP